MFLNASKDFKMFTCVYFIITSSSSIPNPAAIEGYSESNTQVDGAKRAKYPFPYQIHSEVSGKCYVIMCWVIKLC